MEEFPGIRYGRICARSQGRVGRDETLSRFCHVSGLASCPETWKTISLNPSVSGGVATQKMTTKHFSGWWFQPSWKILAKMGIFPKKGWTLKIFELPPASFHGCLWNTKNECTKDVVFSWGEFQSRFWGFFWDAFPQKNSITTPPICGHHSCSEWIVWTLTPSMSCEWKIHWSLKFKEYQDNFQFGFCLKPKVLRFVQKTSKKNIIQFCTPFTKDPNP